MQKDKHRGSFVLPEVLRVPEKRAALGTSCGIKTAQICAAGILRGSCFPVMRQLRARSQIHNFPTSRADEHTNELPAGTVEGSEGS